MLYNDAIKVSECNAPNLFLVKTSKESFYGESRILVQYCCEGKGVTFSSVWEKYTLFIVYISFVFALLDTSDRGGVFFHIKNMNNRSLIISLQAVLRRRDAIQMEYEATLDELSKKKDERDQVYWNSLSLINIWIILLFD